MIKKKLYRSRENSKLSGVLGGLSEFTGADVTFLRLLYVFITFFTGVIGGACAYIICAIIIPLEPTNEPQKLLSETEEKPVE